MKFPELEQPLKNLESHIDSIYGLQKDWWLAARCVEPANAWCPHWPLVVTTCWPRPMRTVQRARLCASTWMASQALLAEAHAAIDEMAEAVDADLREFNQDLPVDIRPAMRGLPAVTERAAAMVVGPADFHVGRFGEWDPNPPHAAGGLYIVYYYRGAKVVQSILDTYPMGFPAAAAQQQVDRVIDALLAMGPEEEAWSDLLLPYCLVMSDLADAGLHDVAGDPAASSWRRCNSRTCATAPCWTCWRRWRGMNRTYRNTCCATRTSTPHSRP